MGSSPTSSRCHGGEPPGQLGVDHHAVLLQQLEKVVVGKAGPLGVEIGDLGAFWCAGHRDGMAELIFDRVAGGGDLLDRVAFGCLRSPWVPRALVESGGCPPCATEGPMRVSPVLGYGRTASLRPWLAGLRGPVARR